MRVTIDTNVVGDALNSGKPFRKLVEERCYIPFVAETTLTLDGLNNRGKLDLLALKGVRHCISKARWDGYIGLGVTFLLCPRIGMPRLRYNNEHGEEIEYSLEHKAEEHTHPQNIRQERYFQILRFIESQIGGGIAWLKSLALDIQSKGGDYDQGLPWFINVANNVDVLGESVILKRFGDWADADAVASHYAYGNDIFCTNDSASKAGSSSVMSSVNRSKLQSKFGIIFNTLPEILEKAKSANK